MRAHVEPRTGKLTSDGATLPDEAADSTGTRRAAVEAAAAREPEDDVRTRFARVLAGQPSDD